MHRNVPLMQKPDLFQTRAKPQFEPGFYGAKRELDLSWNPRILEHTPGYENGTGVPRSIYEMREEEFYGREKSHDK